MQLRLNSAKLKEVVRQMLWIPLALIHTSKLCGVLAKSQKVPDTTIDIHNENKQVVFVFRAIGKPLDQDLVPVGQFFKYVNQSNSVSWGM